MNTQEKLRLLFPEFADISRWPDNVVSFFLQEAAAELEPKAWRHLYERGSIALAAHMMAIRKASLSADASALPASSGSVSSIKTGDEQISYATSTGGSSSAFDASLLTTPYGLEYIRLRELATGHPVFVL